MVASPATSPFCPCCFLRDVIYTPSTQNQTARLPLPSPPPTSCGLCRPVTSSLDYSELAAAQCKSTDITAYHTAISSFLLQDVNFSSSTVLCDMSLWAPCAVLPSEFCRCVFDLLHRLSHLDVHACHATSCCRLFCGRSMCRDFAAWVRTCQTSKI